MNFNAANFGGVAATAKARQDLAAGQATKPEPQEFLVQWPGSPVDGMRTTLVSRSQGRTVVMVAGGRTLEVSPTHLVAAPKTKEKEPETEKNKKTVPTDKPDTRGDAAQEEDLTKRAKDKSVEQQKPPVLEHMKKGPKAVPADSARTAPEAGGALATLIAAADAAQVATAAAAAEAQKVQAKVGAAKADEAKAVQLVVDEMEKTNTVVARIKDTLVALDASKNRAAVNIPKTGELRTRYDQAMQLLTSIQAQAAEQAKAVKAIEAEAEEQYGGTYNVQKRVSLFPASLQAALKAEAGFMDMVTGIVDWVKGLFGMAEEAESAVDAFGKELEASGVEAAAAPKRDKYADVVRLMKSRFGVEPGDWGGEDEIRKGMEGETPSQYVTRMGEKFDLEGKLKLRSDRAGHKVGDSYFQIEYAKDLMTPEEEAEFGDQTSFISDAHTLDEAKAEMQKLIDGGESLPLCIDEWKVTEVAPNGDIADSEPTDTYPVKSFRPGEAVKAELTPADEGNIAAFVEANAADSIEMLKKEGLTEVTRGATWNSGDVIATLFDFLSERWADAIGFPESDSDFEAFDKALEKIMAMAKEQGVLFETMDFPSVDAAKATSEDAQKFISDEIGHLIKDKGFEQKRAEGAAYSIARRKGYKVGRKKTEASFADFAAALRRRTGLAASDAGVADEKAFAEAVAPKGSEAWIGEFIKANGLRDLSPRAARGNAPDGSRPGGFKNKKDSDDFMEQMKRRRQMKKDEEAQKKAGHGAGDKK